VADQPPGGGHPFLVERLHSSPHLRARVEAAERLGISLKRFDGWEPTTSYTHDEQGRLVSSTPEVEWDEEQQAIMLALGRYRDLLCKGCGGWLPETTEIEADGAYRVEPPIRCHRCAAFSIATTKARDMDKPESLLLQVDRRG
jgi:hypothetical protein